MEDFVPDDDINCRWAMPGSVDYGKPGVKVNREADYASEFVNSGVNSIDFLGLHLYNSI